MRIQSLILFSLALAAVVVSHAEEAEPKFSLLVKWTPPVGDAIETRVPAVALLDEEQVRVPVARGAADAGDPVWHLELDVDLSDRIVRARVTDHSRLTDGREGSRFPAEVAQASFKLGWNHETVIFDSGHGKLSFLLGLEGPEPAIDRTDESRQFNDLAGKLDFSCTMTKPGIFQFEVYNPTEVSVASAWLRFTAPATEGKPAFDRVYKVGVNWPAFNDSRESTHFVPKLAEYPDGTPVKVTLERVSNR